MRLFPCWLFPCVLLLVFTLLPARPSNAATELEQRDSISATTQFAFLREDFSQLEKESRRFRTEKSRTPSGLWKLSLFYAAIDEAIAAKTEGRARKAAFDELERKTIRWARRYPRSPSARIARSMVLVQHAWAHRGGAAASTVEPKAGVPFRPPFRPPFLHYLAKARQNLDAHKALASVDPRWHVTMLEVARAENWDSDRFGRLLGEALAREPLFYQTYFTALDYLLPKWHGEPRGIEAFAQDAVERTQQHEGRSMYARIYWVASQAQADNDLFKDSLAPWPRMKEGFEDVLARYPDAWNLNSYANFACLAEDKQKVLELFKRIGTDVVPQAWYPQLHEYCSAWAARP